MNNGKSKSCLQALNWSWLITLAAFFCFSLLSVHILMAEDLPEYSSLTGLVKKVSLSEGILVVKPRKGKRHSIVFTEKTTFKGVKSAEEIKVKQKVKVWYALENDQFKAVKIKVIPDLGC